MCDGSNLTSYLNGALVDNGLFFSPGTATFDQFTLGMQRTTILVAQSFPNIREFVFAPTNVPQASYLRCADFMMRRDL